MKITGGRDYVKFDLENGYVARAAGEILVARRFLVYKDSLKFWEPPHETEEITADQITAIIEEVKRISNPNTVQLIFD